jgi:glycosyltransferase involved in cell wall biosynthesis
LKTSSVSSAEYDVDFSLAMHNRTGKFTIGQDLLTAAPDKIHAVRYWAFARRTAPRGLAAWIMCRAHGLQTAVNVRGGILGHQVLLPSRHPILHLEPYSVISRPLRRCDAVLIHDVGPLTHPALFEEKLYPVYRQIFAEIARVGPHLIFASKDSKAAYEALFSSTHPASSRVIYPAIRPAAKLSGLAGPMSLPRPFFLTVGSIGDRKNQRTCIEAFRRSGLHRLGVDYVICGSREPGAEEVFEAARSTPGVHAFDFLRDEHLAWLYANAVGFVLASRLEGFGLPLAEAIEYGLIPIVSSGTVLEEVAGPAAEGVRTNDPDDIASAMKRVFSMASDERENRLTALRVSIARFSYDNFRDEWRRFLDEATAINARIPC